MLFQKGIRLMAIQPQGLAQLTMRDASLAEQVNQKGLARGIAHVNAT